MLRVDFPEVYWYARMAGGGGRITRGDRGNDGGRYCIDLNEDKLLKC